MSWYLAPSLAILWGQVRSQWPLRATSADGAIGDAAHARGESDHNPDPKTGVVRALDLTVTTAQAMKITAAVDDPRVAYVIYNRKIWTPEKGWQTYSGSNPHSNHVHISIKSTKTAEDDSSLWRGLEAPKMFSPIDDGWVSSEYGTRSGTLHAGIDLRPGGGYGTAVRAAFAGTVEKAISNRVHDRSAAQTKNAGKAVLAPGRTPNGLVIGNPDGEKQLYGHVKPSVKVGAKVKAGQIIGHIDNSGNTSGPHVHFEIWNAAGRTRNPRIDFAYFGIVPAKNSGQVPAPAPKPPAPAPKPPAPGPKAPSATVRGYLKRMGLPQTVEGVKRYQRDHHLHPDGDWGSVTQSYYEWVLSLQRALNKWLAVQRLGVLFIDGYRGAKTKRAEAEVVKPPLNRKKLGYTKASLFKGLGIDPEPPRFA